MPLDHAAYHRRLHDAELALTPDERRARWADRLHVDADPLPRRQKTADEIEADRRAEQAARDDEMRDLTPQVWPRR